MERIGIISIAFILILLMMPMAFADLGPKPSMDFNIIYNTSSTISIVDGEQYQCTDQLCSDIEPLGQYGPQRFGCGGDNDCYSIAYSYRDYQKLIINFSDGKTRESNVFPSDSGSYNVVVNDDGMIVASSGLLPIIDEDKTMILITAIIVALVITLIIELIISYLYLSLKKIKKPKGILMSVAIANIISVPILWVVVSAFLGLVSFAIMEMLVIIFETYFIHLMNKKKIKLKDSFIMSIAMNLASIAIGFVLLMLFG